MLIILKKETKNSMLFFDVSHFSMVAGTRRSGGGKQSSQRCLCLFGGCWQHFSVLLFVDTVAAPVDPKWKKQNGAKRWDDELKSLELAIWTRSFVVCLNCYNHLS